MRNELSRSSAGRSRVDYLSGPQFQGGGQVFGQQSFRCETLKLDLGAKAPKGGYVVEAWEDYDGKQVCLLGGKPGASPTGAYVNGNYLLTPNGKCLTDGKNRLCQENYGWVLNGQEQKPAPIATARPVAVPTATLKPEIRVTMVVPPRADLPQIRPTEAVAITKPPQQDELTPEAWGTILCVSPITLLVAGAGLVAAVALGGRGGGGSNVQAEVNANVVANVTSDPQDVIDGEYARTGTVYLPPAGDLKVERDGHGNVTVSGVGYAHHDRGGSGSRR